MKKEDYVHPGSLLIFGAVGWLFGMLFAISSTTDRIHNEAIENGVAHYQCDSKTGVTTFVWNKCNE